MAQHQEDETSKSHGTGAAHGAAGLGHEEPHEGAPEWLISFADNVTLMMGFFVILLAFTMAQKQDRVGKGREGNVPAEAEANFLDAAVAIRNAFHNPVDLNSMDPNDQLLIRRILWRRGLGMAEQSGPMGSEHDVQSLRPTEYYRLCGLVPFEENSAALPESALESVDAVSKHLRGLRFVIDIRGHVSASEAFGHADRGMRLGFDRAMAVANALVERGLAWRQLRVISCADNDRVQQTAYDPLSQKPNQRVEIVVTEDVLPDSVQLAPGSATPETPSSDTP